MSNSLNTPSDKMFPGFYTVNPITGCTNNCVYCYLQNGKYAKSMAIQFYERRLDNWFGAVKNIFVGSAGDMWIPEVPQEWILKVLNHCRLLRQHTYLFLTKFPGRYLSFLENKCFPPKCIIGTTIETNKDISAYSKAVNVESRFYAMMKCKPLLQPGMQMMINIEPIMEFDLDAMIYMAEVLKPDYISIGPDTKNCGLPEPTSSDILALLDGLKDITEVRVKRELFYLVSRRFTEEEWKSYLTDRGIKHPDTIKPDDTAQENKSEQLSLL